MFFIDVEMGQLIAAFINWGFMMTLLYNLVCYTDPKSRAQSPLLLSLTINLSYFSTSFVEFNYQVYVVWAFADLITVILIYFVHRQKVKTPALYYCYFGLFVNALFHFAMYLDTYLIGNFDMWWLWSSYSVCINVNDSIMILVLIINRDFLGLCRLGRYVRSQFDATFKAA